MLLTRFITLKSMFSRPLRVIFSMLGIVLGVAGLLAISIINDAALASITRLFQNTSGKINLSIIPSSNQQGFSEQTLRTVAGIPGVQSALPIMKATTLLADEIPQDQLGITFFGTSAGGVLLHGIDSDLELLARDYTITQGSFLSSETRIFEIVLVESYADEKELEVGNWVDFLTPNGIEKLKLVGLISREGPGLSNNGSFGVISLDTAQRIFNRSGEIDQIDIIATNTEKQFLESLQTKIQSRIGASFSVIFPASQGERQTSMLTNYQIGLNMMSGIALFVGAFLIYNAFAMTVLERTREYGMLRTVGMTRTQIITQMLIEALFLGLIGSLLGVGFGIFLSRGLAQIMSNLIGLDLVSIKIPASAIIFSFCLGLFVTIAAASIPAYQAGRISPIAALRIRGKSEEGWIIRKGWIPGIILLIGATIILIWNPFSSDPKFTLGSTTVFILFLGATLVIPATIRFWEQSSLFIMKLVFGSSGVLGSRNIQRVRQRTTLTVAALMVGVAMVLVVESMTGSFSADLTSWIQAVIGGDLYVGSSIPLRGDIARRIESVNGVDAVAPIRYLPVDLRIPDGQTELINIMAVDPVMYSRVTEFVFSDSTIEPLQAIQSLINGKSVFISSVLSEKYGFKTGDLVELRTRQGFQPFTISAIVVDFYNQGLVVNMSWSDMRKYFRVNDASTFLVSYNPHADPDEVQNRIDSLYGKRYRLILESNSNIRDRIFTLIDQAFLMFDLMAIIAVVVASLGIVNTLTINVLERTREIGMLRAIGMLRSQVIRMILAEATLMGLVGGLLGIVLGILLARIFLLGMTSMSGYRLDFVVPMRGIITGIFISVIISQLASFIPARRAARLNTLEAIHYE